MRTYGRERIESKRNRLFQQLQVAVFTLRCPGCFLDILEELAQVFLLQRIHSGEPNSYPTRGRAASDHSVQREPLDPNLAARDPKPDFDFGASTNVFGGLYLASTHAGVGKIAPDGSIRVIHAKLYRHKAFNSRMLASILSPVRARGKDIGFERRSSCRWRRQGLPFRFCRHLLWALHARAAGCAFLNFAHGRQQSFFSALRRSIPIRLKQFSKVARQVWIAHQLRPVCSRRCLWLGVSHEIVLPLVLANQPRFEVEPQVTTSQDNRSHLHIPSTSTLSLAEVLPPRHLPVVGASYVHL